MGPVSGLLWLAAVAVAVVCHFLPGAPQEHAALFWGLTGLTAAYAVGCLTRLIPWHRASLGAHAGMVVGAQPLIVAALWLTGGADSYLGPMLVLPMLYVAYFFPLAYAVGYAGLVAIIQFLKHRLVEAERVQHHMARVDPLTGLANRRAFDEALDRAFGAPFTVLLVDVDFFKQINDRFGHTAGDRVLRELAAHLSAEVRAGDCLARIGGDEFALVAGAGSGERLTDA